ncbi:cupin domain-containing protein [Aeribacillus sp. FSL K6-8210]|uniref:cupin domain-containing protein n=1 Tax=Aeribacillus sp. FSL K6-8210 TaxID=2954683 RepID=UPI0030D60D6F
MKEISKQIKKSPEKTTRQYFVGQLSRPQTLPFIEGDKLEIGITSYGDFKGELPHYHTQAYEYQYIISGKTEYLDVETGELYTFQKGDFYVTTPGIKYAQRSQPGTVIFLLKRPRGMIK